MGSLRGWLSDLALGVRLAVGGGRTSMARLALGAVGVALGVTVLLFAAAAPNMAAQRDLRSVANTAQSDKVDGVEPTYVRQAMTQFRGEMVDIDYVYGSGPTAPIPNGMRALPKDGEMVVSPALRDLLASPDGKLLKPRLPGEITGVLDQIAVREPGELIAYVGADAGLADFETTVAAYGFGQPVTSTDFDPGLLALMLIGAVALLIPVFIFVSSASRIAGAERDRRLSALRLVGSGGRQVRRIAAAESLVSALIGLVAGALLFAVLRQYAEDVALFDFRVYVSDVLPSPALVVLIVIAVPLLAVLTAQFALRRTIIEPLGVVRHGKPVRRRLWWRLTMLVSGVVLLVTQGGFRENSTEWSIAISAGAALLLVGVPVLLPWLVERVAGRIHGGPTSWQLAIRRLQLDSGTSARVVGGIAVVLAGAIALQTMLMTTESDLGVSDATQKLRTPTLDVSTDVEVLGEVTERISAAPGVKYAYGAQTEYGYRPGDNESGSTGFMVMDCAAIEQLTRVRDCADGQTFQATNVDSEVAAGQRVEFRDYSMQTGAEYDPNHYEVVGTWTLPSESRPVTVPEEANIYTPLLVTPGAMHGTKLPSTSAEVVAALGNVSSDELEQIRNSVAEFSWRVYIYSFDTTQDLSQDQETFLAIRTGLFAASVFTLMLAGVSLLVLALEHIRERRRPLAVLAACGVPRAVLGRSLLWQIAVPIVLGVLVAALTGLLLATLVVKILIEAPLMIDWSGVGLLSGTALLLGVVVTGITLPFLRSATRLTALRTE